MPVGIALGINRYFVFGLVFGLDLLQIPLFYYILRYGTERIRWLSFLNNKLPTKEKINKLFLKQRFREIFRLFGTVVKFTSVDYLDFSSL